MIDQPRLLVAHAISYPHKLLELKLDEWDLLVRQARVSNLLARIGYLLAQSDLLEKVPEAPRCHLEAAMLVAEKQKLAIEWEIQCIQEAIGHTGLPVVLLKGAAYVANDLPPSMGRLFSDVDILVAKAEINRAEQALKLHRWVSEKLDAYDQRYYRKWMHELPPLRHMERQTVIDVHHGILPESGRLRPDPQKMLFNMQPVGNYPNVFTLDAYDMILHNATHLFHEGEFHHGLRDLVDFDSLIRHFCHLQDFWLTLLDRAQHQQLIDPLFYAVRYAQKLLRTPMPDSFIESLIQQQNSIHTAMMDFLFMRALFPDHRSCDVWGVGFARWALYIRSHYLRMPLYLLIPHLVRKSIRGRLELDNRATP